MTDARESITFSNKTIALETGQSQGHLMKQQNTNVHQFNKNQNNYTVNICDIFSTILSILQRAIAVFINVYLAFDYYRKDKKNYFIWTTICIIIPMTITTLIYINMYIQDKKLLPKQIKKSSNIFNTIWNIVILPFFFRYWRSLLYTIKCKRAERNNNWEDQKVFYKKMVKEESDVSLVRIFECFLEMAPQKILQISIVLGGVDKISWIQIVSICSCFGGMAWCMVSYHRYNRYAQIDKEIITVRGVAMQFLWHFCVSVSRTLCIAIVASLFPIWVLCVCFFRSIIFGSLTFLFDNPKFYPSSSLCNFFFCLALGTIYIFTYIKPKDGETKCRYINYYIVCTIENIACVVLFINFANVDLKESALFLPLCFLCMSFFYIGIIFMILYYKFFHPNVTNRSTKRSSSDI